MSEAPDGRQILLVEDDPNLRELIHAELARHEVRDAAHQLQAYEALGMGAYDLVLLDLKLPVDERDIRPDLEVGFSILQAVRSQPRFNRTAVVVMTAYERTSETTKRAMKLGADEYWNKSGVYDERLVELVERVLTEQERERRRIAEEAATRCYRLEFCQARGEVCFDGLVTFRKSSFRLLSALRGSFVTALARGEPPPFVPSAELVRALPIEPGHLRLVVKRVRD